MKNGEQKPAKATVIKKRIQTEAHEHAKHYHEYDSKIAGRFSYIAGATIEGNRRIDECKKIVYDFQAATIEVLLDKLESLKVEE